MTLSIKTRMILNGVLAVSVSILFAMGAVYLLIQKQNKDRSYRKIDSARQVISAQLENKKEQLTIFSESAGKGEILNSQMSLIVDLLDMNQNVSHKIRELALFLGDQAFVFGARKAVIYNAAGEWLVAIIIKDDTWQLLTNELPKGRAFFKTELPVGKRADIFHDFSEASDRLPFAMNLKTPLTKPPSSVLNTKGKELWLSASAPVKDSAEDNKLNGLVVLSIPIDQQFVRQISLYAGTHLNLFIDGEISVGTLDTYSRFSDNASEPKGDSVTSGLERTGHFRSQSIKDENFFEGIFQLTEKGDKIGVASILMSKSETKKNVRQMLLWLFVIAIACLVFITPFTWYLAHSVTKPIKLSIKGLSDGSKHISDASNQVSGSSQSLSDASSQQAAAIEETASSLEEMSNMTKQNAANAEEAKGMMREAGRIVDKVNENMTEMTCAIEEITRSSEKTGKIIKTIDEIAFQTNLLALNAAVEAARAGEAGAGFAVVADEVRNLAMRAADAAKTTSELIQNTMKAVGNGNELTHLTQEAFKANVEISLKISYLVGEIFEASSEQAKGIDQVNMAITEIDKKSQLNAANSEETAATSEEMMALALQIKGHVQELIRVVEGKERSFAGQSDKRNDTMNQCKNESSYEITFVENR